MLCKMVENNLVVIAMYFAVDKNNHYYYAEIYELLVLFI